MLEDLDCSQKADLLRAHLHNLHGQETMYFNPENLSRENYLNNCSTFIDAYQRFINDNIDNVAQQLSHLCTQPCVGFECEHAYDSFGQTAYKSEEGNIIAIMDFIVKDGSFDGVTDRLTTSTVFSCDSTGRAIMDATSFTRNVSVNFIEDASFVGVYSENIQAINNQQINAEESCNQIQVNIQNNFSNILNNAYESFLASCETQRSAGSNPDDSADFESTIRTPAVGTEGNDEQ
jgi:hypothetical protein